jgi:hypothetical protein
VKILLSVVFLLLVPASAAADRLDRANRLAADMWGPALQDACPDGLTVAYGANADDPDALGWAWPGRCEIGLNTSRSELRSWAPFCDTFLHEAGHVAGHDHEFEGHDGIMLAKGEIVRARVHRFGERARTRWYGITPACRSQVARRHVQPRGEVVGPQIRSLARD